MAVGAEPSPELRLRNYFQAKDGNRPHLLAAVFCETATLEMVLKTGTISFPPISQGIDAIGDVLVRRFAQTYENVYSFYLQRPPRDATRFACDWMVGMSEKATGALRIGCGRYDWAFQTSAPYLVDRLVITIESMLMLDRSHERSIMPWLASLPHPWCAAQDIVGTAPPLAALDPVLSYLERAA